MYTNHGGGGGAPDEAQRVEGGDDALEGVRVQHELLPRLPPTPTQSVATHNNMSSIHAHAHAGVMLDTHTPEGVLDTHMLDRKVFVSSMNSYRGCHHQRDRLRAINRLRALPRHPHQPSQSPPTPTQSVAAHKKTVSG